MNILENILEKVIFAGRWLLAPLYIGLLLALVPILYRFFHAFWHLVTHMQGATSGEITLQVLELLDTVLLGNLIIIVLFAGYENFVSKIKVAEDAEDRPHWMGHVDYSGLKIKLIGSLVAISVIELLKDFMKEGTFDANREGWRIGIHMTFVISGVLFALMDLMADRHKSQR
ncbi:MAG: TIGR00645 family protein [Acidobacteria bacterium]|nr:TIGR00645 family protein [Acidobacteriota bacterium]